MGSALDTLAPLAAGGMGSVSLVRRRDGALFAQKRLHPHLVNDERVRADFDREARYAMPLRHPNVVSVQAVGEDAEGPYVLLDYVHGVSLSELLRALNAERERLPLPVALALAAQAARGLAAVHAATNAEGKSLGLVHRDVSPQNYLVGFDGRVRITDFGIAKALETTDRSTTGLLKGKMGYLAPERLRFQAFDHRADLFALGVVLFELFTSARLYASGGEDAVARRILEEPPPDLTEHRRDAPPELVELLFELLAKDPAHRPGDAAAVTARLEALAPEDGEARVRAMLATSVVALRAERDALLELAASSKSRRPLLISAVALLLSAGIGAALALRPGEPASPVAEIRAEPSPEAAPEPAPEPAAPVAIEEPEPVVDAGSARAPATRARRPASMRKKAGGGVSLWDL